MNKVILLGRLARDPEIRYSQGNEPTCIARYSVAVNRRFKKDGEPDADFIWCVSFGKTAEFMERYMKKGMQVSLCGRLQVREYTDNAGQRKWSTEVIADEVNFAESRAAFEARQAQQGQGGGYGGGGNNSGFGGPPDPFGDSAGAPQTQGGQASFAPPEGFSAITQSIDDDDDLPF